MATKQINGKKVTLTQAEIDEKAAVDAAWQANAVNREWEAVRLERNRLLEKTDKTQLDDAPFNKVAYKTYRQALRDITLQADPFNITWPVEPS